MKTIFTVLLVLSALAACAEHPWPGIAPALSPDGRSVAYFEYTRHGEGYQIVVREPEQSGSARVIESDVGETQLAWSPDGRTLAYVKADGQGRPVLWRVRGDERVPAVLPQASIPFGVGFLGDGRVLVGLHDSLVIVAADGTVTTAVDLSEANPPVQLGTISISRSNRVAFTCGEESEYAESICAVNLDHPEAAPVRITSGHDITPLWRGDDEIIFSRAAETGKEGGLTTWRRHLWSQNLRTGETRQLTFGDVIDSWPTAGANGRHLMSARIELSAIKTPKRREKDTDTALGFETVEEALRRSTIVTVGRE